MDNALWHHFNCIRLNRRSLLSAFWYLSRPQLKSGRLGDYCETDAFDVCIVGSGPAGAVLGLDLVRRGVKTLILESGSGTGLVCDPSIEHLEAYRSLGPAEYPIKETRYRGLGGTSNLWKGGCPRLHPLDFQQNAYTPNGASWPITYADLYPYYEKAEKTLAVRGGAQSAFHPPRRSALPSAFCRDNEVLKRIMHEVGITVDDAPVSTITYGYDYVRVARDILPYFCKERCALLIRGGTVTRLLSDSTGNINGAVAQSVDGLKKLVRARIYVIACGGLETARLLLLSRCQFFPDGVGNQSGVVGRFFMDHVKLTFYGTIARTDFTGSGRSHQFYERFKRAGFGSVILGFGTYHQAGRNYLRISADIEMFPSETNRVTLGEDYRDFFGNPALDLSVKLSEQDIKTIDKGRTLIFAIYRNLGAEKVVTAGGEDTWAWLSHHMGTCRMGNDPNSSVTNGDLRVHSSPNLYVLSSAVFVTSGASNPTLTITALSHRLADHLALRLDRFKSYGNTKGFERNA